MQLRLFTLIVLLGSSLLAQEGVPKLSELQTAKARIVQLENQLAKEQAERAVCNARLAISTQQQQEQKALEAMATLEKETGCAMDWVAIPPTCKGK